MSKRALIVVVSSLALAACTSARIGDITWSGPNPFLAPNPTNPKVYVADDKYIVVDQEPVFVKQGAGGNEVYWSLGSSPYYFPDDNRNKGIEWDRPHPTNLHCSATDAGKTFKCTFDRTPKKKYAYTITVTKDGSTFLKSDPSIMVD